MGCKYWWIRERVNPQFKKPYYIAYGKIPIKEALQLEKSIYGDNYMLRFESEIDYKVKLSKLRQNGFDVRNSFGLRDIQQAAGDFMVTNEDIFKMSDELRQIAKEILRDETGGLNKSQYWALRLRLIADVFASYIAKH